MVRRIIPSTTKINKIKKFGRKKSASSAGMYEGDLMAYVLKRNKINGMNFEKRITCKLQQYPHEFEAEHVGRPWDRGVDIKVRLFGALRTIQCANWDQITFSFSKLFEKLRRSQIGVFQFEGFKEPLVIVSWSVWMDHLTWEKPGREHGRMQLRAYLHSKGLRPHEIEEACRLA